MNNDIFNLDADDSKSFGVVINSCNDAVAIESAKNLTTYTSEKCLDETEIANIIDKIAVNTKVLNQSSNPIFFD